MASFETIAGGMLVEFNAFSDEAIIIIL